LEVSQAAAWIEVRNMINLGEMPPEDENQPPLELIEKTSRWIAAGLRAAASNLRIVMSRFEALEALTRVGLDVDPATRDAINRGRIMRELLRQPRFTVRSTSDQILALTAVSEGWLDGLTPAAARSRVWSAAARFRLEHAETVAALEAGQPLSDAWRAQMRACIEPQDQARP